MMLESFDYMLFAMLKANLSITTKSKDEYLGFLLNSAKEQIKREGIVLGETLEDANLIVMYAAYLFRKRADAVGAMPVMLRYALNNRLFAQKCAVSKLDTESADV